MSNVEVTVVRQNDLDEIVTLLDEIDTFYGDKVTESPQERSDRVASVLFGDNRTAHAVVARIEGSKLVGFASYSFLWPAAGSSRSVYLKELYVREGCRDSGVGRSLMQAVFDIAAKESCSRVEWTTDVSNIAAQVFYEKLGIPVNSDKLFYSHNLTT